MRIPAGIFGLAVGMTVALQGCEVSSPSEAGGGLESVVERLSLDLCDPGQGGFSTTSTNPYFPLVVGTKKVFQGQEGGDAIQLEIEVLNEEEKVSKVTTRVVEELELVNGDTLEVSRNFFAQASDGTVCYFGEEVNIHNPDGTISHEGAWRADAAGNGPGIIMPAAPRPKLQYQMEDAPGVALDEGTIVASGPVTVPLARYTETIRVREFNPLDGGKGIKVFAKNVGLIVDDVVELVSISP